MAPPPNNDFANAIAITGSSGTVVGNTIDATADDVDVLPVGVPNVWYAWTCPASGRYEFDTLALPDVPGNIHSTFVVIYSEIGGTGATGINSLVYRQTDNVTPPPENPGRSEILIPARAGTVYYISIYDEDFPPGGDFALTWSRSPVTSPPLKPGLDTGFTSTGVIFDMVLNPANAFDFERALAEGVYEWQIWRGTASGAETRLATIDLGGNISANVAFNSPDSSPYLATRSIISGQIANSIAVYWDDPDPTYPVYYKVRAVNEAGATFSSELYLPGPIRRVSLRAGHVGEAVDAASTGTLQIVVTDNVPASSSNVASYLIVVTAAHPVTPPTTNWAVQPAITDNAPIVGPYHLPNQKFGVEWGPVANQSYSLNFATYLLLNPLRPGDIVTLVAPRPVDWMAGRLHSITGIGYPTPFGTSFPTLPDPPYSGAHLRSNNVAIGGGSWSDDFGDYQGFRYLADFTYLFGAIGYQDPTPQPFKTFADTTFLPAATWTLPEQFSFEQPRIFGGVPLAGTFVHEFYAFYNLPADDTSFRLVTDLSSFRRLAWVPGSFDAAGIGFGELFAGPGVPVPGNVHIAKALYF